MAPPAHVGLRDLGPRDASVLSQWLHAPDIEAWWGTLASAQSEIRLVAESPSALRRMIDADGETVGYAHAFDSGLSAHSDHPAIVSGAWMCHAFVGSAPHRGRGIGQQALDLLVIEVFATTLAVACAVVVPVRRERAARAYEATGFRWVAISNDPVLGPSWLMLRGRPQR
jgi:aminoglycoside 6'-N-acetyltransferase